MQRWTSRMNSYLIIIACLQIFISVVPSTLATPLPLPLALMVADYAPSLIPANHSFSDLLMTWRDFGLGSSLPSHQSRDTGSFNDLLKLYNAAKSHARNLKGLAAKSPSVDLNDRDFQSDFVTALTGFNTNMDGFSDALVDSTAGSDKGLANYDRTNDLETLLESVVNLNKNVLTAMDLAFGNLPVLGPILGPLVYNLKCSIDRILDALENCSDSIINKLQPLLGELLGHAISTTCRSGVMLLGLCV